MRNAAIRKALAAAQIKQSKLGRRRGRPLNDTEHQFYLWILRSFAADGRPAGEEMRTEAMRLGLDPAAAFATLAREDLVHVDEAGEISVAYPFSGRESPHRVRFPSGNRVYAMCALDALGIAPMFGTQIEIESRDPVSGEGIGVRVSPDGSVESSPEPAVVVTGAIREGDAYGGCCPVLNFFASAGNAEGWLVERPDVSGQPISMPEAAAAGRAIFGDVLRGD